MLDEHYLKPRLVALYDLDSPWSPDRTFYFKLAGAPPISILDLGCGTGILSLAYAGAGHRVTGVDPSSEMLRRAREKDPNHTVDWIMSSAQRFRSEKRFDLIVMTGHAFQVLQTDADVLATFDTMRNHLAPEGRIVFESRNPAIDWTKDWNYRVVLDSPEGRVIESRRLIERRNDLLSFELTYEFVDETLVSASTLRFLSRNEIVELLSRSGLRVVKLLGDWNETPFNASTSREVIVEAKAV